MTYMENRNEVAILQLVWPRNWVNVQIKSNPGLRVGDRVSQTVVMARRSSLLHILQQGSIHSSLGGAAQDGAPHSQLTKMQQREKESLVTRHKSEQHLSQVSSDLHIHILLIMMIWLKYNAVRIPN